MMDGIKNRKYFKTLRRSNVVRGGFSLSKCTRFQAHEPQAMISPSAISKMRVA